MPSIKAETGAYRPDDASNPFSLGLPASLAVGDPLFMFLIGVSNGLTLSPVPSGWTSVSTANMGTGSYVLIRRTGGWQTADGTSLSLTVTATMNLTWSAFALDGTLYLPDTMTLGTTTTRGSSVTTNTALAAGTGASDTLVISAEKASSHTGGPPPTAPSVSPATTQGGWEASSTASTPSAWEGIYGGTPADRTLTYTTASSNGTAFQIALVSASPATAAAGPVQIAVPSRLAVVPVRAGPVWR